MKKYALWCNLALAAFTFSLSARANDEYSSVRTVAVASVLSPQIIVNATVAPVFGIGPKFTLPLSWDINEFVTDKMVADLNGRFKVIALPSDGLNSWKETNYGKNTDEVMSQIAALPENERADIYVVVYPFHLGSKDFGIDMSTESVFFQTYATLSALLFVAVLDGHTGKRLDHGSSHDPIARCDFGIWAKSADQFSDEQKTRIEKSLKNLLEDNLVTALSHAGLITDSDADSALAGLQNQSKSLACQVAP